MNNFGGKAELAGLLADLKEEEAISLAHQLLNGKEDPLAIVKQCQQGLRKVGERYEKREYFISALIMAGEIMNRISHLIQPLLVDTPSEDETGTILIGTVEGDIHDLGKDLFISLARCHGFKVKDLGVDVPPQSFLQTYEKLRPDIIGVSCLLQTGYDKLKETISILKKDISASSRRPSFLIGGIVDKNICEYTDADFFTNDAMVGVRICQKILSEDKD